jgi:hypothetical protein
MEIPFYGKNRALQKDRTSWKNRTSWKDRASEKIGLLEKPGTELNEELALREGAGSAHSTEFKRTGHSSGLLAQRPGMGVSAKGRRLARSSGLVVGAVLKRALAISMLALYAMMRYSPFG